MNSHSPDPFFQACEVASPARLSLGSEPCPRLLEYPFAVVGRDPGCDVVIDDPTVSPRHCYLQAIGPKLLCIDLGSQRGLVTDDGPVPACWLDPIAAVRIGSQILRLAGPRPTHEPAPNGSLMVRPLPKIMLEFQANQIMTRWRMRRALALVGSAPECTVRLNGPDVARFHCALVLTGQGLWVVDLLGQLDSPRAGGIAVNGQRLRFAQIRPTDVLQIGRFRVQRHHRIASTSEFPTRLVDEPHGSGEIELLSKGTRATGSQPIASSSPPLFEALRREYENRLEQLSRKHHAEVECLRDEIAMLRDQIEELQGSPRLDHQNPSPREPQGQGIADLLPTSRPHTTFRTLGAARPLIQGPATPPADALPETTTTAAAWAVLDDSLLTTTHDARQLS